MMNGLTAHTLTGSQLDGLARGDGGPEAVAALRAAQVSKHLLLLKEILEMDWDPADGRAAATDAMTRAQRRDPQAFREVVGQPMFGAWAAIVNRARRRGGADPDDLAQAGAWAAVACARAGVDAEVTVPVRDGAVAVPSVGTARVGTARVGTARVGAGPVFRARLVATAGRLEVRADGLVVDTTTSTPDWQPLRFLTASSVARDGVRIALEDLDPYRHGHHVPPAARLSESDVDSWQRRFADGWRLLDTALPERAAEIAVGLRALVPLVDHNDGSSRSATIRHVFGAFGLTLPPSAAEFAVTLVHEFQHSKLSALLDLMPLTDPDDPGRYFAPWRRDARPLAGLMQGVYAFVAVADTWRALRGVERWRALAETRFAEARLQVDRGLTTIEESNALTPDGRQVAAGLRVATDRLLAEPVPAATAAAAAADLALIHDRWLAHNGTPA